MTSPAVVRASNCGAGSPSLTGNSIGFFISRWKRSGIALARGFAVAGSSNNKRADGDARPIRCMSVTDVTAIEARLAFVNDSDRERRRIARAVIGEVDDFNFVNAAGGATVRPINVLDRSSRRNAMGIHIDIEI